MLSEANNNFILISGESGAGKTEASKKILQYYAVSCPSSTLLHTVRDRMLMSNPVLEVSPTIIFSECVWPFTMYALHSLHVLLGLWKCKNYEKWQLQPFWEVYGHPVWLSGLNKYLTTFIPLNNIAR